PLVFGDVGHDLARVRDRRAVFAHVGVEELGSLQTPQQIVAIDAKVDLPMNPGPVLEPARRHLDQHLVGVHPSRGITQAEHVREQLRPRQCFLRSLLMPDRSMDFFRMPMIDASETSKLSRTSWAAVLVTLPVSSTVSVNTGVRSSLTRIQARKR